MKKRLILTFAMTGLVWLTALGCSNKNIDTAKIRATCQSFTGEAKDTLEIGLKAIEESNYVAAVRPLKRIVISIKLDKDQRLILDDALAKVEAKAAKQQPK